MELDHLRAFVAVMRHGSFAAAARNLRIDPSSVSRSIGVLEATLRVRLFQRTTRKLARTPAALRYFERVERLVEELDEAREIARDETGDVSGTLRITAPVTFAQLVLAPLLAELAKQTPLLSFELLLTDRMVDLVGERVDVAVRLGRLRDSTLVAQKLGEMRYAVCASPSYLRRRGRPKRPIDLEAHDCLRYPLPGETGTWRFRERGGASEIQDIAVTGPVTAANGLFLSQLAIAGMGVIALPRWNVAEALAAGTLIELLEPYEMTLSEFGLAMHLVHPSRQYVPLKTQVFLDFMRKRLGKGTPAELKLEQTASKR